MPEFTPAPPPPDVSLPQMRLPDESVVIFPPPVKGVQLRVEMRWPPPEMMRPPLKVEDADDPVRFKYVAASPPLKVEVELVPVTLSTPANVEVAVEVPLRVVKVRGPVNTPAPVTESGVPGVVVPMPNSPARVSVVRVEVEVFRSLIVPHARSPAGVVDANQCLRSVPNEGLERMNWGVVDADTWRVA